MLLVVLLEQSGTAGTVWDSWNSLEQVLGQSGTAGTAWNKCWDSLDRPSQLGTLLGELGFWDNWTVLSSTVQVRVGLLMMRPPPPPPVLSTMTQTPMCG